jgi:hypothetical protein
VFAVDVSGALVSNSGVVSNPVANLYNSNSLFIGPILNLQTSREANGIYKFISCKAADGAVEPFSVDGNGSVNITSTSTTGNGISLSSSAGTSTAGLYHISATTRANTVFSVSAGGSIFANVLQDTTIANLYASGAGAITNPLLNIQSVRNSSAAFKFISCQSGDGATEPLYIDGTGSIKSTCAQTGAVEVANLNSTNTLFRGALLKGYIAAGGYSSQQFISCANGTTGNVFRVRGDGAVFANVYLTSGADYAEYFEWQDGNIGDEDRRAKTVVLNDGGTIRLSTPTDDPYSVFGIVSITPGFIGDAAENHWDKKYLKDKFGLALSNTVYFLSNLSNENERVRCAPDAVVPEGYSITIEDELILNPKFNPNVPYISRENRPEWDLIGLTGKLRVLPDQIVNPSWNFMKTIETSDGVVHEYLLSSGIGSSARDEISSLKNDILAIKASLGL